MFLTILAAGLADPVIVERVRACSAAVHKAPDTAGTACAARSDDAGACSSVLASGRLAPRSLPRMPERAKAVVLADFDDKVAACIESANGTKERKMLNLWD